MVKSGVLFKRSDTVMHGFSGVSPKSPLRLIHYKPTKWRYAKVHRDVVRVERMDYYQGFSMIYNQGDGFDNFDFVDTISVQLKAADTYCFVVCLTCRPTGLTLALDNSTNSDTI
jgi:hypothetical protein